MDTDLKELGVHDLREQKGDSMPMNQLSFLRDSEKDFWQQLVDSNIRASTIACLWCLKAHIIKKASVAFNKWKLFAAITRYESKIDETMSISKTPTSFANSDISILNPHGTVNKALDNAIAVINRFKSISGDAMDDPLNYNSSGSLMHHRDAEFQSISADAMTTTQEGVSVPKQKHLIELSKTLLDNGKDSETKRQILLQLSNDILDRAKSPQNHTSGTQLSVEEQFYHQLALNPALISPMVPDITHRSSLNALKSSQHPNGYSADFDALFPSEDQYYNTSALHQQPHHHRQQTHSRNKPTTSRNPSRQRGQQPQQPGRPVISQDEEFPYLKFRHGISGDYVKDLVSPTFRAKSATRPTTAPIASQAAKSRSLSAGKSASAAYATPHHLDAHSRRNVSPQEKPRYLISTNASRKKVSSPTSNPASSNPVATVAPSQVSKPSTERRTVPPSQRSSSSNALRPAPAQPATVPVSSTTATKSPSNYPRQTLSPQRIPVASSKQQISISKLDSTLAAIKNSQEINGSGRPMTSNHHISSNNSVSSIGGFSNASRISGVSRTSRSSKKDNAYRELSVLEYMERRAQNKGVSSSKTPPTPSSGSKPGNAVVGGDSSHTVEQDFSLFNSSYEHLDAEDIQNHLILQEAVQSKMQQDSFIHVINGSGDGNSNEGISQSKEQPKRSTQFVPETYHQSIQPTINSPEPVQQGEYTLLPKSSSSSAKKPRSATKYNGSVENKMDKAQLRLLYGDLPDLSDAKRKWERSLRR